MARSLNGNLLGMAARTEKRELNEDIERARRARVLEMLKEFEKKLMSQCIDIEGSESFFEWYANDKNIPPHGSTVERIAMIKARLSKLESLEDGTDLTPVISGGDVLDRTSMPPKKSESEIPF